MVARLAVLAGLLAMPHRHRDALQRQRLALGIEPRGHAGATTQCNGEKVVGPGPGVAAAGGFRLVGAHDMTAGNDDLAERAKAAFADGDFKDSGDRKSTRLNSSH